MEKSLIFFVNNKTYDFNIVHLNTQGLKSKIDQLEILGNESNVDIFGFSETFLKEAQVEILKFDGYKEAAHFCRKRKNRGGVAIYVKNEIDCLELKWISEMSIENHFEVCGISVIGTNYVVVCLYRTPNSKLDIFLESLDCLLQKLTVRNRYVTKRVVIMGDFNVNILENNCNTESLMNTFRSFKLHHTISQPTRITDHSQTCIDNIFTNIKQYNAKVLDLGISDHTCQLISIEMDISFKEKYWYIYKRNSNKYIDIFIKYLTQISFKDVYEEKNPDNAYTVFQNIISMINNLCVPKERIKVTYKRAAHWKTKGIMKASKNKRLLYYKSRNTTCKTIKKKYKTYCKIFKAVTKRSKLLSNANFIDRSDNKSKAMWQMIKHNTTKSNKIKNTIDCIRNNDVLINNPNDIANILNEYFTNHNKNLENFNEITYKPMTQTITNSFFLTPVDVSEIKKIVKKLKSKMSTGHDNIQMTLIKSGIEFIAEPLTYIVNLIFETGIFPTDLKKALVKPLYKKGSLVEISNYRPISLLPNFSKIIEKAMAIRIISFFEKYSILNKNQYGFRKGKNTTMAIFDIFKEVWTNVDRKNTCVGFFMDFSKAFDCVVHKILIKQLEINGIRGVALKLFKSYLENRSQATILDTYDKKTKTITTVQSKFMETSVGVPQGSILGPLLFLVYVNELPKLVKHLLVMFADDATMIISTDNPSLTYEREITDTFHTIIDWLTSINLNMNIDKTKMLQFRNYKKKRYNLNINVKNSKLEEVNSLKFLGVIIDTNLNWKSHIEYINKRISSYCYALSILKNLTSTNVAKSAYYGHIFPLLTYGVIFWGNSVNVQDTFILQKKCLRIIYNKKYDETLRPIFINNKLLTLTCIYILEICLFVQEHDDYFHKKMPRKNDMRSQYKCDVTYVKSSSYIMDKSAYISGIKIFNKLPTRLKSLKGEKFKRYLKDWLISNCFYNLNEFFCCNT